MIEPISQSTQEAPRTLGELRVEIERLKFDVYIPPDIPNFNAETGEDLRNDEYKRTLVYRRMLIHQAARELQSTLGLDDAQFSRHTGTRIPDLIYDKTDGQITTPSQMARINVFRRDIQALINEAREQGIQVSTVDPDTGVPIPQNSLRALLELRQDRSQPDHKSYQALRRGLRAQSTIRRIRQAVEASLNR